MKNSKISVGGFIKIFRTQSFKRVLFSTAGLCLGIFLIGLFFYLQISKAQNENIKAEIKREIEILLVDYHQDGLNELLHDIHERRKTLRFPRFLYAMSDATGKVIFDKIQEFPEEDGWSFSFTEINPEYKQETLFFTTTLDSGFRLAIGSLTEGMRKTENLIINVLGLSILITFLSGGLLGAILARHFLSQVDQICSTAERIGNGALKERISLQGSERDFEKLTLTLNQMLDRMEALVESIKNVSTNIAHDLRTPLGYVRQSLEEVLEENSLTSKDQGKIEHALSGIDDLQDLFASLLRITELESHTLKSSFVELDIEEVLIDLVEAYEPLAHDGAQILTFEQVHEGKVLKNAPSVRGNRKLLIQMFSNLIENALKHSGPSSVIMVQLIYGEEKLVVRVRDTGSGIPASLYKEVFRPFFRVPKEESSRDTSPKSFGIGLSLVEAIAKLHNAEIVLSDNQPGLLVTISFNTVSKES